MSLQQLIDGIKLDPDLSPNIIAWRTLPAKAADLTNLPIDLAPALEKVIRNQGIQGLYTHQFATWQAVKAGENVVLSTPTASGKSLAYNLPILDGLIKNQSSRALYLYPTKALTQDQVGVLQQTATLVGSNLIKPAVYDGDTVTKERSKLRSSANLILTNPDMLHAGILPHHTLWIDFLSQLKIIVIDEIHIYRGVFGSHFANVIRRLLRITARYGAFPQFIITSATIANPKEHAERVIGRSVRLIDKDGSSHGERHFMLFQPPLIDPGLGLRKSATPDLLKMGEMALEMGVQAILFARARRTVEFLLKQTRDMLHRKEKQSIHSGSLIKSHQVMGYRSGYLPAERRQIEKALRDGDIRMVVATNALELGIDIGQLDISFMFGYPGTISSLRQQSGRAGRGLSPSLAVLVLTSGPLDQYLARHTEYIFGRDPEAALIDPDHPLILLEHLRCALFELPFNHGEKFGNIEIEEFLEFINESGQAHKNDGKFYWMSSDYPASNISLRNASARITTLIEFEKDRQRVIGKLDMESSYWMTHPNAIYLHGGEQYLVNDFDLEKGLVTLTRSNAEYYTDPERVEEIDLIQIQNAKQVKGGSKTLGEILVRSKVVGFSKRMWSSGEVIEKVALEMPETNLNTIGYWVSLSADSLKRIEKAGLWTNSTNDYGKFWTIIRDQVRKRDQFRCQVCGAEEKIKNHHVHHISPFREIIRRGMAEEYNRTDSDQQLKVPQELIDRANRFDNLVTLCEGCHQRVEQNVLIRSGLAGLGSVLKNLATLSLMCDSKDLGVHFDPQSSLSEGAPTVVIYDMVPAGIGFSVKLFADHEQLFHRALDLVKNCPCDDGCPACVGPAGENGVGGKSEVIAILNEMI
ncbi:MAG TPA: DEAD/DEAH box helicase [Anaerolineales bacterium]|nr:DEAD/DEAH box helicase [Anaerolineales bacterium]